MKKILTATCMLLAVTATLCLSGCGWFGAQDKSDGTGAPAPKAQSKQKYTLGVSIYAGWMPWYYANESGVLKKWADNYGIEIEVQYMDYVPSVEAYVAGQVDACVMTNMECLDMPAAAGVDSTVVIMGDYSNGNDAILVRNGLDVKGLAGKNVYLVEKTVSHYLLCRLLEENGMSERDVKIINVSDADIAPSFLASQSQEVVVTWNPMVMEILKNNGISKIYDSSSTPGEIQDLCVVNTRVLNANPDFARALTGAWYEVMGLMSQRGAAAEETLSTMADLAKCSPTEYKSQLRTTAMFYTPEAAAAYMNSAELKEKQNRVRQFCFEQDLLGENASSVDVVGIEYPDGEIQGDRRNVKMRYNSTFTVEAAEGKISLKN